MSDKQQSAVDFLHSEYKRILGNIMVTPTQAIEIAEALDQAKELFKQQIIDAVIYGNRQDFYDGTEEIGYQYFNDKFKTESNGK